MKLILFVIISGEVLNGTRKPYEMLVFRLLFLYYVLILFVIISGEVPAAAMEPMPESFVSTVEDRKLEDREKWWKMGLKAISDGKLVVLLLSGGQKVPEAAYSTDDLWADFQSAVEVPTTGATDVTKPIDNKPKPASGINVLFSFLAISIRLLVTEPIHGILVVVLCKGDELQYGVDESFKLRLRFMELYTCCRLVQYSTLHDRSIHGSNDVLSMVTSFVMIFGSNQTRLVRSGLV
ncbi:putative nucleotidyltransferase [Helianthus annuus]|nr:putative nucleotidyltransferase [Helianthus annuus]